MRWLIGQGVPRPALFTPWVIRRAEAVFTGRTFEFERRAEEVIVFRAEDRGHCTDLIAWQPASGKLACWRASAFCLGDLDQIFNPATYFAGGKLRVHQTPLNWLEANREGICIVQPRFAYAHLRDARLVFADPLHAERVKRWCRAPKSKTQFAIEIESAEA